MGESPGESRPEVIRPPEVACCPRGGGEFGDELVSYRQDPDNRGARLEDFSQVIQWETRRGQRDVRLAATFKGFSRATRDDSARAFRDPADLGVFFHRSTMLADILIARYEAESREVRKRPSGYAPQGDLRPS